jgi:hypothetical protein
MRLGSLCQDVWGWVEFCQRVRKIEAELGDAQAAEWHLAELDKEWYQDRTLVAETEGASLRVR